VETQRYDVAVIGCGPSGLTMASLLASRGWKVIALERHPERYGLPRAGHLDHEVLRIVSAVGAHQGVLDDNSDLKSYVWHGAQGDLLLDFPVHYATTSGFQSDVMMFQPVLDDGLYDALGRYPSATVMLGADVTGLEQGDDVVALPVERMTRDASGVTVRTGEAFQIEAAYVVAADGAGSRIRDRVLLIPREDKGFNEDWLDIDVRIKRPLPPEINGQWCNPARPIYIGPLGARHHRFECALLPGETHEHALRPEMVWELLEQYNLGPDDVEPFRQIIYTFEARIAERWRAGRVFLVGDAAHTMPPHMGQGLCAGIRDAGNLAWKLDLVLGGAADESLLDTYELERRPHATTWIDTSLAVGRVSHVLDPVVAAERDAMILSGNMPPLPAPPILSNGIVQVDPGGVPVPPVGTQYVQALIETATGDGPLHDVVGHGFLVVSSAGDPRSAIDPPAESVLDAIAATVLWLGDGDEEGSFRDPTGRTRTFFDEFGVVAVVVRPDYYVAGAVAELADLSDLIQELGTKMHLAVRVDR
jgi:2-polyprenyl-6-methoxyphenol hydroxylase-like FAD-dependent oxidoreductase